jgi:hypothetical protein
LPAWPAVRRRFPARAGDVTAVHEHERESRPGPNQSDKLDIHLPDMKIAVRIDQHWRRSWNKRVCARSESPQLDNSAANVKAADRSDKHAERSPLEDVE